MQPSSHHVASFISIEPEPEVLMSEMPFPQERRDKALSTHRQYPGANAVMALEITRHLGLLLGVIVFLSEVVTGYVVEPSAFSTEESMVTRLVRGTNPSLTVVVVHIDAQDRSLRRIGLEGARYSKSLRGLFLVIARIHEDADPRAPFEQVVILVISLDPSSPTILLKADPATAAKMASQPSTG